jgi:hypothetical protein
MSEKARGEGMLHGLRTERVTLDITIREDDTELFQGYDTLAHGVASYIRGELRRGLGESVRVVSDEEIDALGVAEPFLREIEDMRAAGTVLNGLVVELTAERDAAIRERESWKILADRANDDRDKLQARVAELEAASGGNSSAALTSSTAASGGGEQLREQVASIVHEAMRFYRVAETAAWQGGNSFAEDRARQAAAEIAALFQAASGDSALARIAAAFGCKPDDDDDLVEAARLLVRERDEAVEKAASGNSQASLDGSKAASGGGEGDPVAWGVVVHRETAVFCCPFAVKQAADHFVALNSVNETMSVVPLYRAPPQPRGWLSGDERLALDAARTIIDGSGRTNIGATIDAILARSSPPEVVLPLADLGDRLLRDGVIDALAAAGVAVMEVGRE